MLECHATGEIWRQDNNQFLRITSSRLGVISKCKETKRGKIENVTLTIWKEMNKGCSKILTDEFM